MSSTIHLRETRTTPDIKATKDVTGTPHTDLSGNKKFAMDIALSSGCIDFKWDYVSQSQGANTDVFTFRTQGPSGALAGVITLTYSGAPPATTFVSAQRTNS